MASLIPNGRQQYTDGNGFPLIGGLLYTYEPGTTTLKTTYTTAAATTANTNPVVLNARGEAAVFWDGNYKVKLTSALGVEIYTEDNIAEPLSRLSVSATTGAALIGYIAPGAGAIATTVDERLDRDINAGDYSTIQQAVNAAGANGSVTIPGDHADTGGVTNPSNIPITDLRHEQLGIHSAIGPMYPVTGYPFGNDLRLTSRGPADTYIEHLHVVSTTTASLVVGWNYNVLIGPVTFKGRLETMTGGAEKFSTIAQLVLGRETANEEQVDQGNWEYVDATHINVLCTLSHSGTTDIDQGGSTLLASHDLYILSSAVKPAQNTTYDAPLRLKDLGGRMIAKIPSNIDNAFPYSAWQWGCFQTGLFGADKHLYYQHALSTSQVIWRNAASSNIVTLDNDGDIATVGDVSCKRIVATSGYASGNTQSNLAGDSGGVDVGSNSGSAAITSTTNAYVLWQGGGDPLNPSATAGSLGLVARNIANTTINFASQNTWRASIGADGFKVAAGFGCNTKAPQTAAVVNAACTDLATAVALTNQLRAALIANGICV